MYPRKSNNISFRLLNIVCQLMQQQITKITKINMVQLVRG